MNTWGSLISTGRQHHHVVTIAQAHACGLDPTTLRRRARAECWERLHPGVFALPGSAHTYERQVSAALLAVGGNVAACRWTAAYLWGMTQSPPEFVDVLIPHTRRAPRLEGVRALRSGTIVESDLGQAGGLGVTTPPRTVCDLASVIYDDQTLRTLVVGAIHRRILDPAALQVQHARLQRSPGAVRLKRVLREVAAQRVLPSFEHEIRAFLRNRGVTPYPQPLWVTCPDGRSHRIDIPFVEQRVGVQPATDHTDQDDDDDLQLAGAGWRVARITRPRFLDDRERWLDGLLRLLRTPPGRS